MRRMLISVSQCAELLALDPAQVVGVEWGHWTTEPDGRRVWSPGVVIVIEDEPDR